MFSEDGNLKFRILTDSLFTWLLDVIENEKDINVVIEKMEKSLLKIKFRSYNLKSFSRKQFSELHVKDVWKRRVEELQRIQDELKDERDPDKIYKSRNLVESSGHHEVLTSIKNEDTGEVLQDINSIYEYVLSYNVDNMAKKEVGDDLKEIQKLKWDIVSDMFSMRGDYPDTIPWEVYSRVVRKILKQHKSVFRDYIVSGPHFKLCVFVLINRMYIEEVVPECMKTTKLTRYSKSMGILQASGPTDSYMVKNGLERSWRSVWS